MELINKTKEFIKKIFENEGSGHDYYHTLRVYNLALNIAEKENANILIVSLASLLHDVDDYKIFGGKQGQTVNAEKFMQENNVDINVIEEVCYIIKNMSFKGDKITEMLSLEGKIVQDGDRIDALGAIGIARVFTFGGNKNRPIYIPNNKPRDVLTEEDYISNIGDSSISHFYEKLLKLKDLMYTNTAKEIAESRTKYMNLFLKEFYEEWEGKL